MLSTGVSREHILFLRQSKVKSLGEIGEFFQSNGTEEVELVPVSKIKGLNRGTPGFSWLDHAEMIAGNLSPSSFQSFQQRLEETSLESFREWLKSESFLETNDVVTFNYYAECDEYYAYEGNHRTLWAKLVDAKYIKAKVNKYHYNSAKHSNYKKKL
ncbi:hypothetical protein [Priestia megaterium]|uniref:hypothetical protein n=1 Tax=Priestia megaterium TaxID=1404 RepID=UPI0028776C05|nr:hypothetical protein [Priestia megaterium]MBX4163787.1 hypothetical protein [Priestia megaterium]